MKNINEVSKLLNIDLISLQNLIKPNRNHRRILDKLGCYKEGNSYLFSEEGIKYIAYQYMAKIDECFYYIYPDMRPKVNKQVKNVKVKRMIK